MNTYPKPEPPRVNTFLIAAARPQSGMSTYPFCPSNWSQISSFSVVTYLYVTQWQFPVCPHWLWVVRLCPCLLFESEVWNVKPNRSYWEFLCVCVSELVCECEERITGVLLREEHQCQDLLLKPSSDSPMQRRSDLGKLVLLPTATDSHRLQYDFTVL